MQIIFTQTCTTTGLFKFRTVDENSDDDKENSADDRQDYDIHVYSSFQDMLQSMILRQQSKLQSDM